MNEFLNYPAGGILAFYTSQHPDSSGRSIDEIWTWNHHQLEITHNYIQWLFPLFEKSRFNASAPTLTNDVIETFLANEALRNRLLKSFKMMLGFYGLQEQMDPSGGIKITLSETYSERKKNWINPSNHNYLRLTRILTCLTILGLKPYAQALFDCLEGIYQEERKSIGERTYTYWKNAILTKV